MVCYLIRHGQDDETLRGGWGLQPLTKLGISQAKNLARDAENLSICRIYSSDLPRAMETARILGHHSGLPVFPREEFREVNNGELAGMKNSLALERYPGLFWNCLSWDQCYPGGESPQMFYERIRAAWMRFSEEILARGEDVALVTHGGVIHVIRALVEGRMYSNQEKQKPVAYTQVVALVYDNGVWKERGNGLEKTQNDPV